MEEEMRHQQEEEKYTLQQKVYIGQLSEEEKVILAQITQATVISVKEKEHLWIKTFKHNIIQVMSIIVKMFYLI